MVPSCASFGSNSTPLASRTEVTAASADNEALDWGMTSPARLARSLVDAKFGEEISRSAFNVDVVAKAGPLKLDGPLENPLHGLQEAARITGGKPAALRKGVQAREE